MTHFDRFTVNPNTPFQRPSACSTILIVLVSQSDLYLPLCPRVHLLGKRANSSGIKRLQDRSKMRRRRRRSRMNVHCPYPGWHGSPAPSSYYQGGIFEKVPYSNWHNMNVAPAANLFSGYIQDIFRFSLRHNEKYRHKNIAHSVCS